MHGTFIRMKKLPQFVRAQWHARMTNLFCDPALNKQLHICTCTGLFAFALCTNMFELRFGLFVMLRIRKWEMQCKRIAWELKKVFGLFTASSGF